MVSLSNTAGMNHKMTMLDNVFEASYNSTTKCVAFMCHLRRRLTNQIIWIQVPPFDQYHIFFPLPPFFPDQVL
jgi:hypothetical protein